MQYYMAFAVIIWSALFVNSRKIRGISLQYRRFYKEKKSFLCIDGSKIIPFEQVNDDYCDCLDGSDEPGTSACSNGRFYCTNLGFRPQYIPTSRINDGICDCCDASDEYNSHARCPNTCRNLGRRERAKVEDQIRTVNDGLLLKRQLIEEGISMWQEKQNQLKDLQRLSEGLRSKLEAHKERKLEADARRDRLRGSWRRDGVGNGAQIESTTLSPALVLWELDNNKDDSLEVDKVQPKPVRLQEEGRGVAEDGAAIKDERRADISWSEEDPNIKAAVAAAEKAGADLKEVEEAYETVRVEIRDLEDILLTDYGPEKGFLYLQSQCFELKVHEYSYSLCPFNQVTQKAATGTEVLLGKWLEWTDEQYTSMKYDGGEPCWQGPTRMTLVTLICGTETALRSVKEASKCQYVMELQSPVACQQLQTKRGVHSEL